MLSIIICSRRGAISTELHTNIENTVGCDYELVVVDNSKGEYSIFSAYNKGVELATYDYLCFVHEDVEFLSQQWGLNVIEHLQIPNVGFIGVAGGRGVTQVPRGWAAFESQVNIFHYDKINSNKIIKEYKSNAGSQMAISAALLDGVFLNCRKTIFEKISFDENLQGFHGYDLDICFSAINQSLNNYVVFDIDILHFSHGKFDKKYLENLFLIHKKWEHLIPFYVDNNNSTDDIRNAEKENLHRLKKKMIRARMLKVDVLSIIKTYSILIDYNPNFMNCKYLDYLLIKYSSYFRRKMIS